MEGVVDHDGRVEFLQRKVQETEVLLSELNSLKKNAKVYKQQPNSNIFFLHDIIKAKSETKEDLAQTKAELENLSKK